jgi:O-antigen/teichoic acid export membrane protein
MRKIKGRLRNSPKKPRKKAHRSGANKTQGRLRNSPKELQKKARRTGMSKTQGRLLNTFGAHTFGNIVTVFDRLLMVPLLLRFWGVEALGTWFVIRTFPAYIAVAELGFASYSGNLMTRYILKSFYRRAAKQFQTSWVLISIVSAICLVIVCALLLFSDAVSYLNLKSITRVEFSYAVIAFTLYALAIFQTQLTNAVYRSVGSPARGVYLTHIIRCFELVFFVVMLVMGGSYTQCALAFAVARIIGNVGMAYDVRKLANWAQYGYQYFRYAIFKRAFKPALGFTSIPMALALNQQGCLLAVSAATSSTAVASFSSMYLVVRLVVQYGVQINRTVWPELTRQWSKGEQDRAWKIHDKACRISFLGSLLLCTGLFFMGKWLIDLWTSGKVEYLEPVFALMLVTVVLNSTWYASIAMLFATNNHLGFAKFGPLVGGLSVVIAYIASVNYGVIGGVLGTIFFELMCLAFVLWSIARIRGCTLPRLVRTVVG